MSRLRYYWYKPWVVDNESILEPSYGVISSKQQDLDRHQVLPKKMILTVSHGSTVSQSEIRTHYIHCYID